MYLQSAVLGLVQGITEFLPVSSSGHLVIAQDIFGWSGPALPFAVVLHLATMAATVLFFWFDIMRNLKEWFQGLFSVKGRGLPGWKYGWGVIAGTLVTALVVLLVKPVVDVLFSSPLFVGFALLVTGFILRYGSRISPGVLPVSPSSGLKVGLAQGLAVFPGISRSGATIVTGLRAGLSREDAFSFSFLLSLPAILGAAILEVAEAGGLSGVLTSLPKGWWIGVVVAFGSGLLALSVLRRVVTRGRLGFFSLYCLTAGLLVVVFKLFRG